VVLDEADEMLSMGFIDDVKKILKQAPVERQTACFSATMPRPIRDLINKFLKSPVTVTVEQPKATPSRIEQRVYMVPRGWTKAKALQPIMELEDPEAALIFVRTRKAAAAELTSQLQAAGHSVDEYHGDLSQSQRERLLVAGSRAVRFAGLWLLILRHEVWMSITLPTSLITTCPIRWKATFTALVVPDALARRELQFP
jgi:superfamily II DNA/RNA helicase